MTNSCTLKHTKFQPNNEQWRCPKCGSTNDYFFIDDSEDLTGECDKLHESDYVVCTNCDMGWTGKAVARILATKLNLIQCACCKGTGFVEGTPFVVDGVTGG